MADYTGIVEAGEAFVELLRDNLTPEPISKPELISLCSPHASENNQLTVFLYQIQEDHFNNQAGYHQVSKDTQRANSSRYHLNFLVTAHSIAPAQLKEADQYRMIGAVVQILKDNPVLERRYLKGSIAESTDDLHISLERPNFDELIKIWNNTTSPYKLSLVVRLDSVDIESKRTRKVSRVTDIEIGIRDEGRA